MVSNARNINTEKDENRILYCSGLRHKGGQTTARGLYAARQSILCGPYAGLCCDLMSMLIFFV